MTKLFHYKYLCIALGSILLIFIITSCSNNGPGDQGELFIKVVDAPANYQKINIIVNRVSIHQSGSPSDIGWTYVSTSPQSFNLLTLLNGNSYQLVLSKVPAGSYDHIEINYGQCTLIKSGTEYPLNYAPSIPLGNHTISYAFKIADGQMSQLAFDYDAYGSVYSEQLSYYFNPAIRVQDISFCGWITGSVLDSNKVIASAKIKTYTGLDSVTTYNDTTQYGSFQLSDLPEGTYTVIVIPNNQLLVNDTLFNNVVTPQRATNLGAIILKHK